MLVQNEDMTLNTKLSQFLEDYERQVYEEAHKLLSLSMRSVLKQGKLRVKAAGRQRVWM